MNTKTAAQIKTEAEAKLDLIEGEEPITPDQWWSFLVWSEGVQIEAAQMNDNVERREARSWGLEIAFRCASLASGGKVWKRGGFFAAPDAQEMQRRAAKLLADVTVAKHRAIIASGSILSSVYED